MSDPDAAAPRRRFFDQRAGAPTLIGNGSVAGPVSIAQDAHWQGNLRAHSAVVAGRVSGDLTIETKLEIGKTAEIRGAVRAHLVAIAYGAIVDGEIAVTGSQPIIRFEEKRAPPSGSGGGGGG
jgi:cytoskeletal protein CcmA (bactofilin family)